MLFNVNDKGTMWHNACFSLYFLGTLTGLKIASFGAKRLE
jgi:hypothetical protein